jgi:hypothetical protein
MIGGMGIARAQINESTRAKMQGVICKFTHIFFLQKCLTALGSIWSRNSKVALKV